MSYLRHAFTARLRSLLRSGPQININFGVTIITEPIKLNDSYTDRIYLPLTVNSLRPGSVAEELDRTLCVLRRPAGIGRGMGYSYEVSKSRPIVIYIDYIGHSETPAEWRYSIPELAEESQLYGTFQVLLRLNPQFADDVIRMNGGCKIMRLPSGAPEN